MKKIFTLMAAALFTMGASAQIDNPVDVSATWKLTDGTTAAVVSPASAGEATLTVGAGLEILADAKPFNDINFMAFQAVGEDKGDNKYDKAVELEKYVDFTITPSDVFSVSKVSFDIVKVGTGDPQIFVDIIDGAGTTHIKDGAAIDIRRNNDDTPSMSINQSYEVATAASDKAVTLRIYVGKLANNKQVGIANVVVEGTIKGDNITPDEPSTGEGDEPSEPGEAEGARKWDFTAWSDATVAALKADAAAGASTGWSDDEKNDGNNMEATAGNCFWAADETVANADGYLTANGEVLKELEGLKFMFFNRNLAIAVNYPETSLGSYKGGAYLWLGGSGKDYFTIPAVAGGSIIKIGVESHKPTDPRGITLTGVEANPDAPTTFVEQTWKVAAGEAVDITVTNTNGCHLYYIEITEDDGTGIQAVPVKVVGNGAIINLAGQKVDENYKGIVIKDGKKYIQK